MFRPFAGASGAIHDLSHLDSLSDVAGLTLFVSPRTLYILQNLAAAEAEFQARYATQFVPNGYYPVRDEDALFPLFQSVVENLQSEVVEMPDVIDLLQSILDELTGGILVEEGAGISVADEAINLNAAAGLNTLNLSTPPSGNAWIIEAIHARDQNTAASITIVVNSGGPEYTIRPFSGSGAGVGVTWTGRVTLHPGDYVKAYFWNCVLDDDIYLQQLGYETSEVS